MIIPNFPSDLLAEHQRWHHAFHVNNNFNPPIGWGDNFLRFHRQFIRKVLAWYQAQGYDMSLVQPWREVPQGIRMSSCYDINAERRVLFQPQSFASADELGRFIERLHACIHDAGAVVLNEPILQDLDIAPRSTYFYNIHGMIDNWYSNWERATGGGTPQMPSFPMPMQGFQQPSGMMGMPGMPSFPMPGGFGVPGRSFSRSESGKLPSNVSLQRKKPGGTPAGNSASDADKAQVTAVTRQKGRGSARKSAPGAARKTAPLRGLRKGASRPGANGKH